ncbi:MAG: glycosyltransferase family 4 protein [Lachnospiraceae bacterium]
MKEAKPKIVMISNSFGSLYNFRYELICALSLNYQVVLFTPMKEADYKKYEELKEKGCGLVETPFKRRGKNPLAELSLYRQYLRLLKQEKPAAVLTFTIKPNVYAGMACSKLKIPYMTSVTGLGTAFQKNGPLKWAAVFLYHLGVKKAAKIFVQNESNRAVLQKEKILHGNEVMITGSGVNLEKFDCLSYDENNAGNFLYIGRLMKEKGADEYLEAAIRMKKKYPETQFHMIGFYEDDYKDRITRLEAEGVIVYHGFQDHIQPFLQNAGCVVQPSYHEGMSNVCLEAAASGRPVIASDIPGCRETVEDGKTGYLFQVTDADALYQKEEQFYLMSPEEKRTMGLCGREKMEREFDRKKVVERYLSELEEILR